MPKQATGEVRFSGGIWRARVTLKGKNRIDAELPTCANEAEAQERAILLTEQAKFLRTAGKVETPGARVLLEELGRAVLSALTDVILVISELCGAPTMPARLEGKTFADVAKEWTDGTLALEWPDHVKAKDSAEDERKLKFLNELDVGGVKLGELPLTRFKLDHAEAAMRQLPKSAKRPATRRHYAQCIARVVALAVYPLRIIPRNPLPKGFMPKAGKSPGFSFLYPVEDAELLACKEVPFEERLLFGFLAREGMRAGEALRLTWSDLDLDRGVVTLDRNKTDEARAWALDSGVAAALSVLRKRREPEASALVLVDAEGHPFEVHKLAKLLRQRLWEAKVRRAELHTKGENRSPLRAHDLRGTFVTLALSNGKSEAWVQDRTGHTSSAMLNRYRRAARSASELELGTLKPLVDALPELSAPASGGMIAHALPTDPRPEGQSDNMLVEGSSMISAVPKVGVEPTHLFRITDFESAASANSATSAQEGEGVLSRWALVQRVVSWGSERLFGGPRAGVFPELRGEVSLWVPHVYLRALRRGFASGSRSVRVLWDGIGGGARRVAGGSFGSSAGAGEARGAGRDRPSDIAQLDRAGGEQGLDVGAAQLCVLLLAGLQRAVVLAIQEGAVDCT